MDPLYMLVNSRVEVILDPAALAPTFSLSFSLIQVVALSVTLYVLPALKRIARH